MTADNIHRRPSSLEVVFRRGGLPWLNRKAMKIKISLRQPCKNWFKFLLKTAIIWTRSVHFIACFFLTDIWLGRWWWYCTFMEMLGDCFWCLLIFFVGIHHENDCQIQAKIILGKWRRTGMLIDEYLTWQIFWKFFLICMSLTSDCECFSLE